MNDLYELMLDRRQGGPVTVTTWPARPYSAACRLAHQQRKEFPNYRYYLRRVGQ